jgi:hypothetical protein
MEASAMNKSLDLPENVYRDLIRAAQASGKTPVGWIQERLNGAADREIDAQEDQPINAELGTTDELEDKGFREYCKSHGDPSITLEEVRQALAAIPGSMTAACTAERDED